MDENVFKNVTRYATKKERRAVERIDLDPAELDQFMSLLRKGLIEAASAHEKAVQENLALRVETTIRLSRPVYDKKKDVVEDLTGQTTVTGDIKARKVMRKAKDRR